MKFFIFICTAFVLMNSNLSFGGTLENPKHNFKKLGIVWLVHEVPGEPISTPERLTINIKCQNSKAFRQVALIRMCSLAEHEYDDRRNTVRIKVISGRIVPETGEVFCDQVEDKEFPLTEKCSK